MKRLFYFVILTLCIVAFSFFPRQTFAVENPTGVPNNRFGIHILFPGELEMAEKLVNSNGGDWGYVTIPIQSIDRNLEKWQKFMDDCKRLHIIPIIRIATYPQGNFWTKPTIFDHLDFTNFLNSLSWPTQNRYIIVYNEPNSNLEWGGAVDAPHYARELLYTIEAFKRVNPDFFIISAGLDSHAPSRGTLYENLYTFLRDMDKEVPGIFTKIDGFASHSYPNKNFSENPKYTYRGGIYTYRDEVAFLRQSFGRDMIPIFITETGWEQPKVTEEEAVAFYTYAFTQVWKEQNIIAVTPFLLNGAGSAFSGFSILHRDGSASKIFDAITSISKAKGEPEPAIEEKPKASGTFPKEIKNLRDVQDLTRFIAISPPLRTFLKWFFY